VQFCKICGLLFGKVFLPILEYYFPKMTLRFLPLLFLFYFSVNAFAQDQKAIDSLTHVAKKIPQDTSCISAYVQLSQSTLNSDYQKSIEYANNGLQIAERLKDNFWTGRCYLQLGFANNSFGYNKEAIENLHDAISYFEKWGGTKYWIAKSDNSIGNAERKLGRLKDATESYLAAKTLYEEVKDKKGVAGAYNNLGLIVSAQGQPKKARDYYMLARQMNIEINNQPWLGINLMNIGTAYYNMQQFDSAEYYFKESQKIYLAVNDMGSWSTVMMNLGNVYTSQKNYKKAMEEYNLALDFDRKNGKEAEISFILYNIAGLYTETGEFEKAQNLLDSSVILSTKYSDHEALDDAYKGYTLLYEKTGDFKNAYKYYKLYATMKDSMTSSVLQNQMEQMEESFREEKLKEKNASLEQAKQLQDVSLNNAHIINYATIGGIILALLLAFTLFKRYQLKQKANIVLEERNYEIESQKGIIEQKNKDISDSINYAKNIQDTLLPELPQIQSAFKESFIFFRPKNIVSGDFYWFSTVGNKAMIAVADCTGHGVPGAFMSMIGIDKINQAVLELRLSRPSEILSTINRLLKTILKQDDLTGGMRDGMDVALISVDKEKMSLEFSGANRPLWIIRKGELIELKPTKASLGGHTPISQEFITHEFALEKNDCIYLFSDGYADQFGGVKGKKMMTKNFKRLLVSLSSETMESQKKLIAERLNEWQGNLEQVDDICIMGVRIQ
jgi:serine phosphatase RsbU (regulator of sigma subunit)